MQEKTLSATIKAAMTDKGDGTYTYNFSVQLDGEITIIVRLVNTGVVNWKWYSNTNASGSPVKTNTTSNINFNTDGRAGNFIPGQGENFSAILYGSIAPIASGVYTFTLNSDDGAQMIFNGNTFINKFGQIGIFSETFSVSLTYGGYYDFTIYFNQGPAQIVLELQWSASFISNQDVPSSAFTTYNLIGASPYQMTTVWPTGYTGNDPTSTTAWNEIWGDGLKVGSEQCDDGNTINNDGCQSDCTLITPGFAWTGGGSTSKDVCSQCLTGYTPNSDKSDWVAIWGDGLRMTTEICDDGNTSNNDGCSSLCAIESGYTCSGGSTTSKDTWVKCSAGLYQDLTNPSSWIPHWTDGLRAGSEAWDDANTSSGDGWSSTWSIESGYIWNGGSTSTKDTWIKWSSGFYPNSSKTQCITSCGDGLKAGTEMCDDGNTINNDGCESDCTIITAGFAWTGGGSTSKDLCSQWLTGYAPNNDKSAWVAIWGDSLRMPTESCDDGNTSNNDGCSNLCAIESGYTCSGGSTTSKDTCVKCSAGFYQDPSNLSRWITHCGDGKRAGSEVWDDANTSDGDGWSSTCSSIETGYVWAGGSPTSHDTCTFWTSGFYQNGAKSLWVTNWGDGLRAGAEKCDDNNSLSEDGCNNDWSSVEAGYVCSGGSPTSKDTWTFWTSGLYQNDVEVPTVWVPHWGDGLKSGTEEWDDGNNTDNDGWQADWTLITPGYVWAGGGTTTKDDWIQCSTGYIQNPTKDSCIPNWGDGFRYGTEKCDDGNTLNGDGWKSDWTIDSGWIWKGGTNISKDVWTKWDKGFYQNDSSNPTSWVPKWGDGLRVS